MISYSLTTAPYQLGSQLFGHGDAFFLWYIFSHISYNSVLSFSIFILRSRLQYSFFWILVGWMCLKDTFTLMLALTLPLITHANYVI